jgi:hypothetical protein
MKPTKPGFWWYIPNGKKEPIVMTVTKLKENRRLGISYPRSVALFDLLDFCGQWLGEAIPPNNDEFICTKCGLRTDSTHPKGDF